MFICVFREYVGYMQFCIFKCFQLRVLFAAFVSATARALVECPLELISMIASIYNKQK